MGTWSRLRGEAQDKRKKEFEEYSAKLAKEREEGGGAKQSAAAQPVQQAVRQRAGPSTLAGQGDPNASVRVGVVGPGSNQEGAFQKVVGAPISAGARQGPVRQVADPGMPQASGATVRATGAGAPTMGQAGAVPAQQAVSYPPGQAPPPMPADESRGMRYVVRPVGAVPAPEPPEEAVAVGAEDEEEGEEEETEASVEPEEVGLKPDPSTK